AITKRFSGALGDNSYDLYNTAEADRGGKFAKLLSKSAYEELTGGDNAKKNTENIAKTSARLKDIKGLDVNAVANNAGAILSSIDKFKGTDFTLENVDKRMQSARNEVTRLAESAKGLRASIATKSDAAAPAPAPAPLAPSPIPATPL